nr:MAG TPA: hypothetical protein [Caudoviricetes sp.]
MIFSRSPLMLTLDFLLIIFTSLSTVSIPEKEVTK